MFFVGGQRRRRQVDGGKRQRPKHKTQKNNNNPLEKKNKNPANGQDKLEPTRGSPPALDRQQADDWGAKTSRLLVIYQGRRLGRTRQSRGEHPNSQYCLGNKLTCRPDLVLVWQRYSRSFHK